MFTEIFIMRKLMLAAFILFASKIIAQTDTIKLLVGFPITDYMVDLNDSTKIVQIVPGGIWEIKDKQVGIVKGIYRDGHPDTAMKGWGRCSLIKGDYYYFAIHYSAGAPPLITGDLLYTFIQMPLKYIGQLTKIAAHNIRLQKVTDENFYNRGDVFLEWNKQKEDALLDSMTADIRFTGKYFKENNPGMNKQIVTGTFTNKMLLETMIITRRKDVSDFLDYIIARPRNYAGHDWKISEIFATWLFAGAPTVTLD
jgi:hypothetical protein